MARDHARIRLDIWADDDFRDLPALSQWLYLHLLTSSSLNFCGVTDWRPARIAALADDLGPYDVEFAATFLEDGQFIVVDRDTEEVLIRSFIKHDGLLRSPNVTKALVKSHAAVGSGALRAVVIDQLTRLKEKGDVGTDATWKILRPLLRKRSMTVAEAFENLPPNPSANPSDDPSGDPSENRAPLRSPFSLLPSPRSSSSSDSQPTVTSEPRKRAAK